MFKLVNVNKVFPGVHALKDINFEVKRGEVVGLVGENGAGKSTLMKVIYGAYQHDGGEVLVDDKPVKFQNPREALEKGIGMVFQEQSLITNLSVMENIFLGYEHMFSKFGVINTKLMATEAKKQLAKVKLDIDPTMTTSSLSFAQRQLVELAKVLTLEERVDGDLVILLDEPTSMLAREEVELLFSIVKGLTSRASFIFVSHRLDEVIELSDRIYVFKDGEVVDTMDAADADVDVIQHKMVGREVDKEYYRETKQLPFDASRPLMHLTKATVEGSYKEISLTLHAGEVLCLVGTEGSGREAVMRSIFGMQSMDAGELTIGGQVISKHSPQNAVAQEVGYLPRERKIEGIVSGLNVYENMTLSQLNSYSKLGFLTISQEREFAKDWIKRLSIKASSVEADCGNLSGGNQQKVVLAKWRGGGAKIMMMDHPTRGLDIGAKEDVYEMIREMCEQGIGVLLVADTLEEAIGLSHTIVVLKDGAEQHRFDCQPDNKPKPFDLIHYMI